MWTITPGQTSVAQASAFLSSLAEIAEIGSESTFQFRAPPESRTSRIYMRFLDSGGTVGPLEMNLLDVEAYSVADVLSALGEPEEVWLKTYAPSGETSQPLWIYLFYPSDGVLAAYYSPFPDTSLKGSELQVCLAGEVFRDILTWPADEPTRLSEAVEWATEIHLDGEFLPLYKATDITTKHFLQAFAGDGSEVCLTTSVEAWSPGL